MSKIFKMAFEIAGELDSSFRNSFKGASGLMAETREEIKKLKMEQRSLSKGGPLSKGFYDDQIARHQKQIDTLNKVQDRYTAAEKKSDKAAAGREKFGGAFLKSAAVGALVFGPMINEAMQFESAMADVRKVVDFDTPEQYKQMQADIVKLSQSIPMTAEGLAAIVAAGGQAGIEREGLVAFAEDAAKMGVAFDISADQAGDMMAKWRTAFKMNQDEVRALADQVNFLSDSTAATAPQISGIISRIGPLGEVAGISSNQLAALGATLASMGIQEEVAATGIKNMMLVMNQGEAATKRQQAAFEALGLDATEMAKRMQVDGKTAILDLLNAAKKLPKEQQASVLTQLFGRESVAAIAPLLNNTEALVENFEKVAHAENYAGSMAREFASRSATTANAMQLAKNSVSGMAITLGSMFLPVLTEGLKTVGDFVNRVASWAQANPETAKTIGTVAAGAIGLTMAVSGLGFAYYTLMGGTASVIKSLVSLHTWLTVGTEATNGLTGAQRIQAGAAKIAAAAQWLWNVAMTANPVGLVIVGIAGLIAIGYLLYKNWDTVSKKAMEFWGVIWGFGKKVFDFYVDFWTKLPERVAYGVGYMIGFIATIPGRIWYWGGLAWNAMTDWVTRAIDGAVYLFMNFPSLATTAFQNFITVVKNWGNSVLDNVKEWASRIPSIIMQAISDAGSNLKHWFFNIGNRFSAGKQAGASTGLPGHAEGGIFNKEHVARFAEGNKPEAAIAINNSRRSRSIWEKTGELLGMPPRTAGGGSFSYAPTITIQGNADANTANQIRQALEQQKMDFQRMMKEYVREQARVSLS